jgi:hypothetical protein
MSDLGDNLMARMRREQAEAAAIPVDWQPYDPVSCSVCHKGRSAHPTKQYCPAPADSVAKYNREGWVRACGCSNCVPGNGWRTCPCACHRTDQRKLLTRKVEIETRQKIAQEAKARRAATANAPAEGRLSTPVKTKTAKKP